MIGRTTSLVTSPHAITRKVWQDLASEISVWLCVVVVELETKAGFTEREGVKILRERKLRVRYFSPQKA